MRPAELGDSKIERDVEQLLGSLKDLPQPVARPVLVVVSGLPGSGKSFFSQRLTQQVPLAILEIDVLRKALFGQPTYSGTESARLFKACHLLISKLLKRSVPVLFDATNLVEARREYLYHIADGLGVKLILVYIKASADVVYKRLESRGAGMGLQDRSDAGREVYERMRSDVEPIRRSHFVVDTSRDIQPALEKVVREIRRGMRTSG